MRGLLGIRRSVCAVLFDALGAGVFVAVASPHIMGELRDVLDLPSLRRRYELTDDEVAGLLVEYGGLAEIVPGAIGPIDVLRHRLFPPRIAPSWPPRSKAAPTTSSRMTPGCSM